MVNEKLIVAGFGGQGVLMIGKMVALSGMENGMEVSWLPAYGSEMRGGTATCSVNVSDEPVDSPMIQNPTALIIMNLPSLLKYESWAVPGAKVIINSSLVEQETTRTDIEVYKVPFNDLATQAGNERGMNMLVAGTYAAAHRGHGDGVVLDTQLINYLCHQICGDAVAAAGAVCKVH